MKKEITFEEAKGIIELFPESEHFISANFRQWVSGHNEYCDNSMDLYYYHQKCEKIYNEGIEKREKKLVEFCKCTNEDVTVLEAITVCRHCLKQIKFK